MTLEVAVKELSDGKLEVFEDVAVEGAKQIKAYFKYEGTNSVYKDRARVGATAISAYARMRASETNRMAVELMLERQTLPEAKRKALKA